MNQVYLIELGMGIDQHGQDVTAAAIRAIEDAIRRNAMPGLKALLPGGDFRAMEVEVTLALPCDWDKLDVERVRQALPYGRVTVRTVDGGMRVSSGTVLPEKGDTSDLMIVVNAAVKVGF
ncbi:Lin0512 family protein [Pelomicrobium sp.]|jgi:uncharacterized protein (TIGR02058 family)|uniref:Lin0512 family protein n=1 Tax=Pelomicrobium sp. TaxID=2815319 RepID=UPI002FDE4655